MNLDNVTVELRPRSEWEAADLGARMIRRDVRAIYAVWFAITLPLLALTCLAILFTDHAVLATFIYWWLEPVADGPILRIISRRLFGESADIGGALRTTPQIAWRNKLFILTPWRLHFARSTTMPVTQLEGLTGTRRRARAKVINLKIFNHGTGITAVYQHLVLALYLGIVLVGFALIPTSHQGSMGSTWMDLFWMEDNRASSLLTLGAFYIAQSALQPWFVGAGFGLYINCRTLLEAWDIEVAFRRMVQKRTRAVTVGLAMLACFVTGLAPDIASARDVDAPAESAYEDPGFAGFWVDADFDAELKTVLQAEALRDEREVEEWQPIDETEQETSAGNANFDWLFNGIRAMGKFVSLLFEFGLWILLCLLLYLIYATRDRWLPYLSDAYAAPRRRRTIVLADGELSVDSLPEDIPGEVLRLWKNGAAREALGLMYRGSVFAAVSRRGVQLADSATEGMCLAAVRKQTDSGHAEYFGRVVAAWMRCSYGAAQIGDETVHALARQWSQVYEVN